MYGGKRKYGRNNKPTEQPVDNSTPTYMCGRCNKIKLLNEDCIEITALEKGTMFMYTRLCACCATMLQTWIKG